MTALSFGPLSRDTVFVCVDMQRLFLEPGPWYCPAGLDVLPVAARLAKAAASHCVFTRFITVHDASEAHGQWRRYYQHWDAVTRSVIGDAAMDIHADLAAYATPARTFDKPGHDSFSSVEFSARIADEQPAAMVLFGIETDVCVLATAMSAVDRGMRVVIVTDAVASSDTASHDACLRLIYPRFDQQIELASCQDVLAAWMPYSD